MLNPYTPQEVTETLADCYRSAALEQADMRRVAEALESLRQLMLSDRSPLEVWEALESEIGRAEPAKLSPLLVKLRNGFVSRFLASEITRLRAVFDRDAADGFAQWLQVLSPALAIGRLRFCVTLSNETFPFPEPAVSLVEKARQSIPLALEERYEVFYDLLLDLIRREEGPLSQQAQLTVFAALIELYIFERPEAAAKLLEKAEELAASDDDVICGWGEYWLEKGDYQKAADRISHAIELSPQRSGGYLLTGDLKQRQDDLIGAEEWFEKTIAIRSWEPTGYLRLVRVISRPGSFELRQERINRLVQSALAVDQDDPYGTYVDVGSAHRDHGRPELALEWYQRAIDMDPARSNAYVGLGHLYLTEKSLDFDRSRKFFQQAIDAAPGAADGFWGMALSWEQQEEWRKALDYFEQTLEKRPQWDGKLRPKFGEMHWKLRDLPEAEAELLRALRCLPENAWTLSLLHDVAEELYKQRDDSAAALRIYQEIHQIKGPQYEADYHNHVGIVHYYIGDYEAAVPAFQAAIAARETDQVLHANLANSFQELKQWEAARQEMQRASDLEVGAGGKPRQRDLALIYNTEGNAHYGAGDFVQAAACYGSAIKVDPDYEVLHSNLALAWDSYSGGNRSENLDRAIAALERARELKPDEQPYASRLEELRANRRWCDRGARDYFSSGPEPFAAPVILEWPADLLSYAVGNEQHGLSSEMRKLLDEMEERLWTSYGVIIPDICVRPFTGASVPGRYLICLSGIPTVAAEVSLERRLFTGTAAELELLQVKGSETISPISGNPAYWIEEDDWQKVEAAGLRLLGCLENSCRHLETVISRNLPEVVGHQEIMRTLAARLPEAVEEVRADGALLTDLVMVLRAFLAEQVTIAPLATLLPEFRRLRATGIPLVEIVEELRSLEPIRSRLPANAAYHSYISVSREYEEMIAGCIENGGSQPVLAMEPALCQEALTAVRDDVSGINTWAAVVVENAAIRPYVRKLIELEFPYLWVLSRAELLPAQAEKFIGKIEWEAAETDDETT